METAQLQETGWCIIIYRIFIYIFFENDDKLLIRFHEY